MAGKCLCDNDCIIESKNIEKRLKETSPCSKCLIMSLKKFKPIEDQICVSMLDNNFGRCKCGKRSIDIVMAHVLKIILDEKIPIKSPTLRNGAIPLMHPFESKENSQINKNSLIVLHPEFNKKIANRLIDEVSEIKGVLKGNSNDLIGIFDNNSKTNSYDLLAGCDFRCDIINTSHGKIVINKKQRSIHLEFPPSLENKILKLEQYLKGEGVQGKKASELSILDATCGSGALGIFCIKYGFKNVAFNDINPIAIELTKINLEANEFNSNDYEIYNVAIEDLNKELDTEKTQELATQNFFNKKFDYCIIDSFPKSDDDHFREHGVNLAKKVIII